MCFLLRMTTIAATSLPDPRDGCERVTENLFTSFALHRCGDCMFSGHTVILFLCALVWNSYYATFSDHPLFFRLARGLKNCMWLFAICGSLVIISNRAHYTIDVLIAAYIAVGVWYFWAYFWNERIVRGKTKYFRTVIEPNIKRKSSFSLPVYQKIEDQNEAVSNK